MKGVLYSADFVKDSNGNFRLLELNTNTATQAPSQFDLSGLEAAFTANSITKLHILATGGVHDFMSAYLKAWAENLSLEVQVDTVPANTLFAPTIEEFPTTFVLRLAYDEGALFDSTYAASDINTLTLFADANEEALVVPFYYPGAAKTYDYLDTLHTNTNTPDYVTKNCNYSVEGVSFYKVGTEASDADKLAAVKGLGSTTKYVTQYLSEVSNNKTQAYRYYGIMYLDTNNDIQTVELSAVAQQATLEVPTTLDYTTDIVNQLPVKHFYEFSTNAPKPKAHHGVLESNLVKLEDGTPSTIGSLGVGDVLDTYNFEGAPSDDVLEIADWSISGSTFPTLTDTSASVVGYSGEELYKNMTYQIELANSSSLLVGVTQHFFRYSPTTNTTDVKFAAGIQVGDSLYKKSETGLELIEVVGSSFVVLHDSEDIRVINVEPADYYFVGEDNIFAHNAKGAGGAPCPECCDLRVYCFDFCPECPEYSSFPCPECCLLFGGNGNCDGTGTQDSCLECSSCLVEGTEVLLSNGDVKSIEDIVEGDQVYSFNEEVGAIEADTVSGIRSRVANELVTITLEDGTQITSTPDHPHYMNGHIASYTPEVTKAKYELDTIKLEVGGKMTTPEGDILIQSIEEVLDRKIVYSLTVEHNHNYFANNVLTHNKGDF